MLVTFLADAASGLDRFLRRCASSALSISMVALLGLPPGVSAQPPSAPAPAPAPAPAANGAAQPPPPVAVAPVPEADADAKRMQRREVVRKYPPSLGRVLKSDPSLLREPGYLARYPALSAFLAVHPEVASNPNYYFDFVYLPGDAEPLDAQDRAFVIWRNIVDGIAVFTVMVFIAGMLAWLVKTALNHRRWLRLSRTQNEVHNKLLDRFAGTNELLAYVESPAGRRFLEAAPIDVESLSRGIAAPLGRILWSVQAGLVLAVGGFGFLFASGRVMPEVAEGLWMIGALSIAFGLGFVVSGVVGYVLSRRLGLLEPAAPVGPRDAADPAAP
ncbi:MAG: hypothetical protein ACT4QD_06600 [Acidobacteriota bacterium]